MNKPISQSEQPEVIQSKNQAPWQQLADKPVTPEQEQSIPQQSPNKNQVPWQLYMDEQTDPIVLKSNKTVDMPPKQPEVIQKLKQTPIPDQSKPKQPSGTQQYIDVDVQPQVLTSKSTNPQKIPIIPNLTHVTEEESEFEIYTMKTDSSREVSRIPSDKQLAKPVEKAPISAKPEPRPQEKPQPLNIPGSLNSTGGLRGIPEIDIEASLEDSSQLDNAYLSGLMERKPEIRSERPRTLSVHSNQPSIEDLKKEKPGQTQNKEHDSSLNSSQGSRKGNRSNILTSPPGISPRQDPTSPTSVTSNIMNWEIQVIENRTLNSVPMLQRISMIDELIRYAKEKLMKLGRKISAFNEEISLPVLENLCVTYIRQNNRLNVKSIEELIGFILALARFLPEPFLPPELLRSKSSFNEEMIIMKLPDQYDHVYRSVRDFLSDSIRNE